MPFLGLSPYCYPYLIPFNVGKCVNCAFETELAIKEESGGIRVEWK